MTFRLPTSLAGALFMAAAASAVAVDTIIARVVVQEVHPTLIVFFRSLFSLMALAPWLLRARGGAFRTHRLPLHVLRAILKLVALVCFFSAVALMPLASVTAIAFATPLFAAAGAVLILGEPASLRRTLATLGGFAGVLLIIRPGAETLSAGALLAVAAAIGLAAVGLMVKVLSRHDPPNTIVTINLALSAPLALLPALPFWTTPSPTMLGWLVLQGLLGAFAQLCFTRGMRRADASLMMPIDFIRLPLVAGLAYVAFNEVPDALTWIGAVIVCGSILLLLGTGFGPRSRVETAIPER